MKQIKHKCCNKKIWTKGYNNVKYVKKGIM